MMGFGRTLKNIGGRATSPAMAKAERTALGSANRTTVRHSGGGASAGLNAQKPAYLAPNGAGYDNPAIQAKRNIKKEYRRSKSDTINGTIYFKRKTLHRTDNLKPPKFLTGK